jgi:hypothetical protein
MPTAEARKHATQALSMQRWRDDLVAPTQQEDQKQDRDGHAEQPEQ